MSWLRGDDGRDSQAEQGGHDERGDTLIEVLLAIVILGIAGVALLTAFATAITASSQHRNLATLDASARGASDQVISQVQQSGNNAFGPSNCTNIPPGTGFTPTWNLSGKFTVTSYTVTYWNGSNFVAASQLANCTGYEPQQWSITIGSGSYSTTVNTVIYDPQAPPVTGGSTAYQLVFLEPSGIGTGTVNAAVSPQPIVAVEDQAGDIVYGDASSVTLTATGGTGTLSSCTGRENEGIISFSGCSFSGTGTYAVTATDSNTKLLKATGPTGASYSISLAPPAKLVYTTAAINQSASANATTTKVTIQEDDAFNNADPGALTVNLASSSATGFFTLTPGGSPATAVTSVPIAGGQSSVTVYYGDTTAGSYNFSASSSGLQTATQPATINPAAASQLVFSTQPANVPAGTGFPVGVTVKDQFGNTVTTGNAGSTDSIKLTLSSTTVGFASGSTTTVSASNGVATFTGLKINTPGPYTITATDQALKTTVTPATSAPFTILPAPPSKLVFTSTVSGNHPVANTATVGPFVVQVQDQFGNAVANNTGTPVSLLLQTSSTGTTFFTPVSGGSAGATVTIPANSSSSTQFFYSDTASGAPTLSVSAAVNTFNVSGTTNGFTMTPGSATKLGITTQPPTSVAVHTNFSVGVSVQDQFGNTVTSSTDTVALTPSSGTMTGTTSKPAVAGVATFSGLQINTTGSGLTITATDSTHPTTVTSAQSNPFSVTAGAPSTLTFTSTVTGNHPVGSSANVGPFAVQVRDAFGNAVNASAAVNLTLTSNSTGTTFFTPTSGGTTGVTVTIPSGSSTSPNFFYSDTKAGTPTITASATVNGTLVSGTTNGFTMTAGNASQFNFTTVPAGGQPVGTTASVGSFTVQLEDAFGNPVNASANTTLSLSTNSTGTPTHAPFFTTNHLGTTSGTVTIPTGSANSTGFYYSDTLAGTPTITVAGATVNGQAVTGDTTTVTMTAGNAKQFNFTSTVTGNQPVSATANVGPFTVQLEDTFGNPVNANTTVTLGLSTSSTGTTGHTPFFTTTQGATTAHAVTIPAGSANSANFYYSDSKLGTPTITVAGATVNGQAVTGDTTNGFTMVVGVASQFNFTTVPAGGQPVGTTASVGPFTVQLEDSLGNPINASAAVTLNLGTNSAGAPTHTPFFTTTHLGTTGGTVTIPTGSANSTSFYYSDTLAGTPTITVAGATVNGQTVTGDTASVTMTAGNASQFNFTAVPTGNQPASANANVGPFTVQLEDTFGNPVNASANTTLGLSSNSTGTKFFTTTQGGNTARAVTITNGQANSASFYYSDTLAGTPTITVAGATVNGQTVTGDTANVTIVGGAPSTLTFTSTVTGNHPVGSSANVGPFAVQVRDAFGNAVNASAAVNLTLTSNSTGTTFFTPTSGGTTGVTVTIPSGSSTSPNFFYSDTKAGTPTITASATVNGTLVSGTTNGFTMTAGNASQFNFTTVPAGGQPVGTTASVGSFTVQLEDAFGNPVNASANTTLSLSTNSTGTPTHAPFFTTNHLGTTSGTVTIPTGSANSTGFYYSDTLAGTPTITVAGATVNGQAVTGDTTTVTMTAGNAKQFNFTSTVTGNQPVSATANVGPFTVQLEDTFGNPVNANTTVTLGLSTSSTGTTGHTPFFTTTQGATTAGAVTIPAGSANSANFYYSDSKLGTPTITVAGATVNGQAVTGDTTNGFTMVVGVASKFAFTTTVTGNHTVGSTASVGPFAVQVQDQLGNPVANTGGAVTLSLSSSSTGTTFFTTTSGGTTAGAVTIPNASATSTSFFYSDTKVGAPTITLAGATVNGQAVTGTTTGGFTMTAGTAKQFAFTTAVTGNQPVSASASVGPFAVQLQDAFGNPVNASAITTLGLTTSSTGTSGHPPFFTTTSGGATAGAVTIPNGSATSTNFFYSDTKVGGPTITLAAATVNGQAVTGTTTGGFTMVPGSANKFAFTTTVAGNQPVSATASVGPFAVQVQDAFGNAVTANAAVNLTLTSNSAGTTFFTPTSGGTTGVTVTIPSGSSTSPNFFYSDTGAGTPTITASATVNGSAVSGTTNGFTMTAGAAKQFNFTTVPTSNQPVAVTAGVGPFAIQLQDAFGNPVNASAITTLGLTTSSTGTSGHPPFFTPTHNGAAAIAVTIPNGSATSTSFYYSDTLAGTPTITVAAATVNGQAVTGDTANGFTMTAGAANSLSLSAATATPAAGAADNLTVTALDSFGNVSTSYPTTKNLTFGGANTIGTFAPTVSNSSGTAVNFASPTAITFTNGVATVSGSSNGVMKLYQAGTDLITVTDGSITNGTGLSVTVGGGVANKFGFSTTVTGNHTVGSTASVGPFAVQAQDQFGNAAINTGGAVTLSLSSSSTGTKFFTTTSGGTTAGAVTIPNASATSTSFFYSDTAAGAPTLTVAGATVNGQAVTGTTTGGFTMTAGTAKQFAFTTAVTGNQPVSASASVGPFAVQLQDAFGNPVNASAITTLGLTTSSTGTSGHPPFFTTTSGGATAGAVTIPNGSATSTNFFYSDTKVGGPTITLAAATVNGQAVTGTTTGGFTMVPGSANKFAFTTTVAGNQPVSATASVGPFAVQVQDAFGNAVTANAAVNLTLTSNSAGTTFFTPTSGGTTGVTVTIPSGSSTSPNFFYSDTGAGTPTITASATVNGSAVSGTTNGFTMTAGAAKQFNFTTVPTSNQPVAVTAGVGPFAIQLQDAFGNPVNASAITTLGLTTSSTGTSGHPPFFTPTHNGAAAIAVTIPNGSATSTSFYYSDTLAGTPTITVAAATVNGQAVTGDTANGFTMTAGAANSLSLSAATATPAAGAADNLTVTALDSFGNVSTSYPTTKNLTFGGANTIGTFAPTVSNSSGTAVNFASPTAITFTNGVATVSGSSNGVMKLYQAGTDLITVTDGSITNGTGLSVTVGGGVANKFGFSTTVTGNHTVGSTASVGPFAVQAQDQFGNAAINTGGAVTLSLSSSSTGTKFFTTTSGGTTAGAVTIPNASATSTSFFYSDTAAGAPTLTVAGATVNGQAVTGTTTGGFTMVPGTPNKLVFNPQPPTTGTGGATLASFGVSVEDSFGNIETTGNTGATDTVTLSLATKPTGGTISSATTTYTNVAAVNGTATFSSVALSNTAGSYTFKATDTQAGDTGVTSATSTPATVITASRITLVGAPSSAFVKSGTSLTIPAPSAMNTGDVLLAQVTARDNLVTANVTSITAPPGWTVVTNATYDGSATLFQFAYTCVVGSSGCSTTSTSWTWSWPCANNSCAATTSGDGSGGIFEFSGVNTTTPIDVSSNSGKGSGASATASAITTTQANDEIVALFASGGTASFSGKTPTGTNAPSLPNYAVTSSNTGSCAGTSGACTSVAGGVAATAVQSAAGSTGAYTLPGTNTTYASTGSTIGLKGF